MLYIVLAGMFIYIGCGVRVAMQVMGEEQGDLALPYYVFIFFVSILLWPVILLMSEAGR